ncbi:MAG: (Fe-S)-binding protein [Deltaproteobacteria bacterium]|nr:(Fe-S)-binding protein [Deltaproteobacteria bacterium]
MVTLKFNTKTCEKCPSIECLMKCQHMSLSLAEAKEQWGKLIKGEPSRILEDCVTCYACEEYCRRGNHPFYMIVERQEEHNTRPVPTPLTEQQLVVMRPRGRSRPEKLKPPLVNMCAFPLLRYTIRGRLFEGASTFGGYDVFCNIMWLHFARNSAIRERLPLMIENIKKHYLDESGTDEFVCFHDECYGTYTHLAPAFGIDVPFKPIHLFEYLTQRLTELKDHVRPLQAKVAYQRPCSNRLIPETEHWVDDIFSLIGAERVKRKYDGGNALCCAGTIQAQQKDDLADDLQQKNIEDMLEAQAQYCVFNCPACFFTLKDLVAERGITPIMMSDLCHLALGE